MWKVFLAPDYLDERSFRVTLVDRDRFAPQCREDRMRLRMSYLAAFVLILLYAETRAVAGLLERMAA